MIDRFVYNFEFFYNELNKIESFYKNFFIGLFNFFMIIMGFGIVIGFWFKIFGNHF